MPPYSYIEARELANLIKSGAEAGKDYQVVDVRGKSESVLMGGATGS